MDQIECHPLIHQGSLSFLQSVSCFVARHFSLCPSSFKSAKMLTRYPLFLVVRSGKKYNQLKCRFYIYICTVLGRHSRKSMGGGVKIKMTQKHFANQVWRARTYFLINLFSFKKRTDLKRRMNILYVYKYCMVEMDSSLSA